jgi:hypothetical protein
VNLHINISATNCIPDNVNRSTSVTCTSCDPPPGKTGINTSTPQAILDINGELRIGMTQLPPAEGMLRYNATNGSFMAYSNGSWRELNFAESDPFENSDIITTAQGKQINQWIGNMGQKWERCYQKTVDGSTPADFHNNCDNRGPTVTIIELHNNRIFGGYTDVSWSTTNAYRASYSAFIFSINNDKKYPLGGNNENAIYDHASYGPTFGTGHDFYVNTSMNLNYVHFPYSYSRNGVDVVPSDAGAQELAGIDLGTAATIIELEVWIQSY